MLTTNAVQPTAVGCPECGDDVPVDEFGSGRCLECGTMFGMLIEAEPAPRAATREELAMYAGLFDVPAQLVDHDLPF